LEFCDIIAPWKTWWQNEVAAGSRTEIFYGITITSELYILHFSATTGNNVSVEVAVSPQRVIPRAFLTLCAHGKYTSEFRKLLWKRR
jgi:hypothetical protein